MHGAVHDYIATKTVKGALDYKSGETHDPLLVKDIVTYPVKELVEQPIYKKILDIGALDICGSVGKYDFMGKAPLWKDIVGCEEFVGLDMIAGLGVDVVANAHNIPFEDETFDLVTCANMLEHDAKPLATIKEARRVLKTGQPFLLTTVNQNWDEHPQLGGGDTETFNKITLKIFTDWILEAGFVNPEILEWNDNLFCWGIK